MPKPITRRARSQKRKPKAVKPSKAKAPRPITNVQKVLELLAAPGTVFEIRALQCKDGTKKPFTSAGYFDDAASAAAAIKEIEEQYEPDGIYWTLNPVNPKCLARSPNEMKDYLNHTTQDKDIVSRRFLPLDFDPVRPSGVSATNDETERARELMQTVRARLRELEWPEPFAGETGNGCRLLYGIDLPNDKESADLVKAVLEALAERFSTDQVKIDTAMFNASRIDKVFGTWARKGHDTDDQPHRQSKLLSHPKRPDAVTIEQLISVAATKSRATPTANESAFDVAEYLKDRGKDFRFEDKGDRRLFHIECPFDPSHGRNKESSVIQFANGMIVYKCQHDSCSDKDWKAFKAEVGEPDKKVFKVVGMGEDQWGEDQWGEAVPIDAIEAPAFPVQALPPVLGEWVAAVAENSQTAPDLAAMMGLAATSVALAKKVVVQPRENEPNYIEPANIWTCTPLPSANRKSFVVRMAREPFDDYLKEFYAKHGDELKLKNQELKAMEKRKNKLTTQLSEAEGEAYGEIKDNLRKCLVDIKQLKIEAYEPRYFADDVTPERLAVLMGQHSGRMAVITDEGGCFDHFAGIYNSQQNIDVYLHGHSGGTLMRDRQTGGEQVVVENAALTIGVSPQPQVIAGMSSKDRLQGRGLLARFLWAFPKSTLGARDWEPEPIPAEVKDVYHKTMRRMITAMLPEPPVVLTLAPDAYGAWKSFAETLEPQLTDDLSAGGMQPWAGKLPGAVARIAMLLHKLKEAAGKPFTTKIAQDTMRDAISIAEFLIPHAKIAFKTLRSDPEADDARVLQEWIINLKRMGTMKFTKSQAQQNHKNRFASIKSIDRPLEILVSQQICRPIVPERKGPGRPSAWYEINPQLG